MKKEQNKEKALLPFKIPRFYNGNQDEPQIPMMPQ